MQAINATTGTTINRRQLEDRLILRAWEDEQFRLLLVQDPRAAISRELEGMTGRAAELPPQLQIHVHEERAGEMHFILPCRPDELADDRQSLLIGWRKLLR